MFFEIVGDAIQELGIKIVYAQEGERVDYKKRLMSTKQEHYAKMKGRAIAREVNAVYSQYEGQTWKNIISIGDSDFERVGTISSCEEYMRKHGALTKGQLARAISSVKVDGHVYNVRVKTLKMLDQPTISELTAQLALLREWLSRMVEFDGHFDVDLGALDEHEVIPRVESTLSDQKSCSPYLQAKGSNCKYNVMDS